MTVPTLDRMNQARCSHCRQRFCIGPKQPRRLRCPFCRFRLDPEPPTQLDDRPVLPHAFVPIPSATTGSFEPNSATYASIVDFVEARRQRLYSRERDVGLRWRDGETTYRAAWIEDTREFYLVQLGAPDRGGGHVELLAAGLEIEALQEAVAGWREAQDDGDHSLDWLRDRVRCLTVHAAAMAAR
jgi:hypothetical protein